MVWEEYWVALKLDPFTIFTIIYICGHYSNEKSLGIWTLRFHQKSKRLIKANFTKTILVHVAWCFHVSMFGFIWKKSRKNHYVDLNVKLDETQKTFPAKNVPILHMKKWKNRLWHRPRLGLWSSVRYDIVLPYADSPWSICHMPICHGRFAICRFAIYKPVRHMTSERTLTLLT